MKYNRIITLLLCLVLLVSALPAGGTAAGEDPRGGKAAAAAVNAVKPEKITITGSRYVAKGKKITLKAAVAPAKASQEVTWTSSDPKTAAVNSKGTVRGLKAGTVKITAVSKANKKVKAAWKITVTAKAASSVSISGVQDMNLTSRKKITLKAKAKPSKAAQSFTWKSSDKSVATVSSKGVVKAVAPGTVRITATATDGSKAKAAVTVTVKRSGWLTKNGDTFYYDDDGNMVTGWRRIDHLWYFFRPDGIRLEGDPSRDELDAIYKEDEEDGLWFANFQFNADGSYNICGGFFDRTFGEYDEDVEDWVRPEPLQVDGTTYPARDIVIDFDPDKTVSAFMDISDTDMPVYFSGTWKRKGDDVIVTVGGDQWKFTQYEGTFTLEIDGKTFTVTHGNGNG